MEIQDNQLKALAERYKAGQCTPEEVEKIKEWYDSFEENGYQLPVEAEIRRASDEAVLHVISVITKQQKQTLINKLFVPLLKIAAMLVLVTSAGLLIFRAMHQSDQALVWQQVWAAPGQKKQITLSDGSVISLNSASSIRYPRKFSGATREIYLKGEAFFEVAHNKQHPFIIHTEQLKVQVLGTSFDVKAYHQDEQVEVAVATGKVGVTSGDNQKNNVWMLTPGEQVNFNKSTGHFIKQRVLIADITDWQQNVLTFNMETLENISHKLERAYGVTFVFKDKSLLKKRFQLNVKNENLTNVMRLLSISGGGFQYKITEKQVTIG